MASDFGAATTTQSMSPKKYPRLKEEQHLLSLNGKYCREKIYAQIFYRLFVSYSLNYAILDYWANSNIIIIYDIIIIINGIVLCFVLCNRFILAWVSGLIWSEVKQLWDVGLEEYVNDMWNVIDFVTNSLYVATVALRVVAYYRVQKENEGQLGEVIELQREQWDTWDPMLISEGLFSAANIFR